MPLVNLSHADLAALEIGRLFMRAHSGEQQAATLAQQVAEKDAQIAEFTNGVEKSKPAVRRKART